MSIFSSVKNVFLCGFYTVLYKIQVPLAFLDILSLSSFNLFFAFSDADEASNLPIPSALFALSEFIKSFAPFKAIDFLSLTTSVTILSNFFDLLAYFFAFSLSDFTDGNPFKTLSSGCGSVGGGKTFSLSSGCGSVGGDGVIGSVFFYGL